YRIGDAASGVVHDDDVLTVLAALGARGDAHFTGAFDGVERVDYQVHHRLVHETRKAIDHVRLAEARVYGHSIAEPMRQNGQQCADGFTDAALFELAFVQPRKGSQFHHQVSDSVEPEAHFFESVRGALPVLRRSRRQVVAALRPHLFEAGPGRFQV